MRKLLRETETRLGSPRIVTLGAWRPVDSVPPIKGHESRFLSKLGGLMAFAIPALTIVEFRIVGKVFAGELLALLLLPLVVRYRHRLLDPKPLRLILVLGALWLLALVISDIWHQTAAVNRLRGSAEIVILLDILATLRVLTYRRPNRLAMALLGIAAAGAVQVLISPTAQQEVFAWQLGGGSAVAIVALIVAPRLPAPFRRVAAPWLLYTIGVWSFLLGARNLGGTIMITAAYLTWIQVFKGGRRRTRLRAKRLASHALAVLTIAALTLATYSFAASSGFLGEDEYTRNQAQSAGGLGLLIGGRQDNVGSVIAIADSPFLGHGSRPENAEYTDAAIAFLTEAGYEPIRRQSDAIPNHSFLLGAWISAGIAGAAFWIFIVYVGLRALVLARRFPLTWRPIAILLAVQLIWNVFFTPLSASDRTLVPAALLVFLLAYKPRASLPAKTGETPRRNSQ